MKLLPTPAMLPASPVPPNRHSAALVGPLAIVPRKGPTGFPLTVTLVDRRPGVAAVYVMTYWLEFPSKLGPWKGTLATDFVSVPLVTVMLTASPSAVTLPLVRRLLYLHKERGLVGECRKAMRRSKIDSGDRLHLKMGNYNVCVLKG